MASDDGTIVGYLVGDDDGNDLQPGEREELDGLLLALGHPSTWDEPPADLGDRVVAAVTAEATSSVASPAATTLRPVDAAPGMWTAFRRRTVRLSIAAAGAAAAVLVAVVLTHRVDQDTRSADATVPLAGTTYELTGELRAPLAREQQYRVEIENQRQRLGHALVDVDISLVFGARPAASPASSVRTLEPKRRLYTVIISLSLFVLILAYSAIRLTPPILERWRGIR